MTIEIANRLQQLRKNNGLSQEQLAEKIGVSRQAVSKWERSEASPDTDNLILLARLYKVSLDDLLNTHEDIPRGENSTENVLVLEEFPTDEEVERSQNEEDENNTATEPEPETNKTKVKIGLGGVYVQDGEDVVDVSWKGIRVKDKEDDIDLRWGKNVHEDEEAEQTPRKRAGQLETFPFPVVIAILYLFCGFILHEWVVSLLLYLLIPLYYCTIEAVKKRNPNIFPYPVVAVGVFLLFGFCYGAWHPSWMIFLTIPFYYWAANWTRK